MGGLSTREGPHCGLEGKNLTENHPCSVDIRCWSQSQGLLLMAVTDRALEEQWWNGVGGEKEFQEGGYMHIPMADSC